MRPEWFGRVVDSPTVDFFLLKQQLKCATIVTVQSTLTGPTLDQCFTIIELI